jgi:Zn-dependent M28 family amino/carboxypeptidase
MLQFAQQAGRHRVWRLTLCAACLCVSSAEIAGNVGAKASIWAAADLPSGRQAEGGSHERWRQASAPQRAVEVDSTRLLADLRALSAPEMGGRLTGTAGNQRAAALIRDRFKALKLQPVNGSYEQKFPVTSPRGNPKPETSDGTNLIGVVPGTSAPDRFLLVTAHFDHLGVRNGQTYPGADDNASGVAALLEIAAWFAGHPTRSSLVFVGFDGEEQGLQGSRYFVSKPPIDLARIAAVVNLDMIGRGDKNVLFAAGTAHYPALKAPVLEAAKGRAITVMFGHDQSGVPGVDDWTNSSDHGSFHAVRIPFLYFGVEDHADYHRPTDTADKIPSRFFVEATGLVLDTIRRLADSAD